MFLAHFSAWGYQELMEMDTEEIKFWLSAAINTFKKINGN